MAKYVDVEPIIEYAKEEEVAVFAYPQGSRKDAEQEYRELWHFVRQILEKASAVNIEPIVKCEDCEYADNCLQMTGERESNMWFKIDYCSRGSKKDCIYAEEN